VREELIERVKINLINLFGEDTKNSKYYPRIVNQKPFDSLQHLLDNTRGKIKTGGDTDREELYFAPTIIDKIDSGDVLMKEEIFDPLLPVLTFTKIEDAISFINARENHLPFIYFGKEKKAAEVLNKTSSGGSCINDTLLHITNHHLPFGGVGHSGLGKYHGKATFLVFSNQKSVISTPTWIDIPFKYPPFKYFGFIKKIL
jgi:aldehyde dehydrogenase (NAD+)